MLTTILVLAGVAFLGYAIFTQYNKTPVEQGVPARVWGSLVAAFGVLGAAIMAWFQAGAW